MAKKKKKQKLKRGKKQKIFISDKIEVKSAGYKGRGVFAVKDIKKGEILEVSPTILISEQDTHFLQATILGNYLFQASDEHHSLIGLGYTSLYNHDSKKPNATYVAGIDCIIVEADRNIKADEEITIDYGWHEDGGDYGWEK